MDHSPTLAPLGTLRISDDETPSGSTSLFPRLLQDSKLNENLLENDLIDFGTHEALFMPFRPQLETEKNASCAEEGERMDLVESAAIPGGEQSSTSVPQTTSAAAAASSLFAPSHCLDLYIPPRNTSLPISEYPFEHVPPELLPEILRHLHQPFHFYHYSNALLGIIDPPPGSKPWNPVGVQLVSRRWLHVARRLFYHQVAFDTRDETSIQLALRSINPGVRYAPLREIAKGVVWIDAATSPERPSSGFELFLALPPLPTLALAADLPHIHSVASQNPQTTCVLTHLSLDRIPKFVEIVGYGWKNERPPSRNRLLTLRLPHLDIVLVLDAFLASFQLLANVPALQLDLPFDLLPSLLETIFPKLTSLIQHPSLSAGRDAVLRTIGRTKRIIFGTVSNVDAAALRGKIEELGALEVFVEVVVLEL